MSTIQKPSNSNAQIIQFERLLDSDEAASLLKIHPKTLQKLARKGEIVRGADRQALALPGFRAQ